MSKASEWANKLALAGAALSDVRAEKPEECAVFVGDSWLEGHIGENGLPQIVMRRNFETGAGGQLRAENLPRLLEFARWILDTFEDAPRA